jgi:hypothetical protein
MFFFWLILMGMQECMIGIVFAEEAEAKTFFKKVNNRKAEKCCIYPQLSCSR